MYKVGGANRPMCTNPEGCPGVNNPAHRAIFRHQCPQGKSCLQQGDSSHCEEFAHDLFFQEERKIDQTSNPSLPQQVKPLLDIGLRGNGDPEPPRPQWEDPNRVYQMPHVGPSNSNGTIGNTQIVAAPGTVVEEEQSPSPLFPAPKISSSAAAAGTSGSGGGTVDPWAPTNAPLTGSQQTFSAPAKQSAPVPQQLGAGVFPGVVQQQQPLQQQQVYFVAPAPSGIIPQPGQPGVIPVATASPYAQPGMAVPLSSGVGGFSAPPLASTSGSVPFGYAQIGAAQAPSTAALRPTAAPFPASSQQPTSSSASAGAGGSHPFPSRHRMPAPR